jgi:dihydroneopterin aldolase
VGSSRILITGITAQGRHGANPGERIQPQDFMVDLDVLLEVGGDSLQDTLDYRMLADLVRNTVSQTSFILLESLAQAIAEAIWDSSAVAEVTATVHKPAAATELGVEDVSAESTFTS